jgi:hypothetical protein
MTDLEVIVNGRVEDASSGGRNEGLRRLPSTLGMLTRELVCEWSTASPRPYGPNEAGQAAALMAA